MFNKNIIIKNHCFDKKVKNNINQTKNKNKEKKLLNINDSTKKSFSFSDKIINLKKNINKNKKIIKNLNKENNSKNKFYNLSDIELNTLTYKKAIKYDKRTYFQYYCSLLRQKHLIFFTFISKNDYNLFIIKLSILIFSFSLYFSVNTLFFGDSIIHKVYENEGKLQFIYSILKIIYSTIISCTITLIVKFLALSNRDIIKLQNNKKNKKETIKESSNLIKRLNIKFRIYFFISFFLLLFFWYLISAFCAVYNNSQLLLIENILSSFVISLIYPFGINLIPGIFRIIALRSKKNNKKCIYTIGNLISIF